MNMLPIKKQWYRLAAATVLTVSMMLAGSADAQVRRAAPAPTQADADFQVVVASGEGETREQAIQDALRNAVAQAAGVAVQSETKMENYVTISDVVATKASGYVTKYELLTERRMVVANAVTVKATVSMKPLKADAGLLARSIGGVRFLVYFDERNHTKEENELLDYAVERVNEYLSKRKYRYIERKRAQKLRTEASNLMQESNSELGYAQQMALMADAQFIIYIKNIVTKTKEESFGITTKSSVGLEVKAYDNCTGEGLGTVVINGPDVVDAESDNAKRSSIEEAIENEGEKLLESFLTYIGEWVNNGTPYELRFYNSGSFRDLRNLRQNLKSDANFGGEMEIVGADNFQKLNCTFRRKPDELADKVLDLADQLPEWKSRQMDVKFIYGRQISFAPKGSTVPGYNPPAPEPAKTTPATEPVIMQQPTPKVTAPVKTLTRKPVRRAR